MLRVRRRVAVPCRSTVCRIRIRPVVTAVAVVTSLLVAALAAGCGSSSAGGSTKVAKASGTTKVTDAVLPLVDEAPTYIAQSKGFFSSQHLVTTLKPTSSGPASVASVLNGQDQFSSTGIVSLILAVSKGVPIKGIAAQTDAGSTSATDSQSIMVSPHSGITSVSGLVGKTIGVGSLKNVPELAVRSNLQVHGVDYSKVHVVELQEPDMVAAVQSGKVDAALISEPFLTVAREAGLRDLVHGAFATGGLAGAAKNVYYTSDRYLQQNPDVVKRFAAAVDQATADAAAHPGDARQAMASFTKISPKLRVKIILPQFPKAIDCTSVMHIANLMKQWGWIQHVPSISDLLWSGAATTGSCH